MSEYSADSSELRDLASRLNDVRRSLDAGASELQRITRNVRRNKTLDALGYDEMLDDARVHLNSYARHVDKFADAALLVSDAFERHEEKAFGTLDEGIFGSGPLGDFVRGDLKKSASLASGTIRGAGFLLGIGATGAVTGEILTGKASLEADGSWNPTKGEAHLGVKGSASGSLAKVKAEGDYGIAHGEVEAKAGNAAVKGELGASLFRNGVFDPGIKGKVSAEASAVSGSAKGRIGSESYNAHVEASGSLLSAKAEAGFHAGKSGVGAKVEAGAYLAEGKVSGGLSIAGIKLDVTAKGKAGGAGVEAGFGVDAKEKTVQGNIGAGLGIGGGLEISIDYSGFAKGVEDTVRWWNSLWK